MHMTNIFRRFFLSFHLTFLSGSISSRMAEISHRLQPSGSCENSSNS
jgi:hypothetical protein